MILRLTTLFKRKESTLFSLAPFFFLSEGSRGYRVLAVFAVLFLDFEGRSVLLILPPPPTQGIYFNPFFHLLFLSNRTVSAVFPFTRLEDLSLNIFPCNASNLIPPRKLEEALLTLFMERPKSISTPISVPLCLDGLEIFCLRPTELPLNRVLTLFVTFY